MSYIYYKEYINEYSGKLDTVESFIKFIKNEFTNEMRKIKIYKLLK